MDRITIDQDRINELRSDCQNDYPDKSAPLPGTALKLDDQVMWLGFAQLQVLWGYEMSTFFCGYCPDMFGDAVAIVEGEYITDRAPADPQETPMPIYPQQQQQRQKPHDGRSMKERLRDLIKLQTDQGVAKKMREVFKERGLLDDRDDKSARG